MLEFECEAILFDLDGVLVDSTKSVIEVWTAWSERNGIPRERTLGVIHGRRTIEGLQILAPHLDLKSEVEKLESAITLKKGGTIAIPGAAELLASLPDRRWAVVTSGLREFAKVRLRDANLPIPNVLVAADDVTKGKPHPEPYLKGAELLGMTSTHCMVVEDAPNGIRAGKQAGMRVVGLTTTYSAKELHEADAVVQSLSQIGVSPGEANLLVSIR
jgi:sugar-phosphatase